MNKKRILLILIFMVIFICVAYYILFLSNSPTNGVATTKDVEVQFYKIGVIKEYNSNNASASISDDKMFVYINVPELMGKGAYARIPVTIKNVGIRTARLVSIAEYGFDSNGSIDIKYEELSVAGRPLKPGDETTFYVSFMQIENILVENDTINIRIELNYVQDEGGRV